MIRHLRCLSPITQARIRNIKTENIGYLYKNGRIIFSSEDSAVKYAKNRVLKALRCDKPFERGLVIDKNSVIKEVNGNKNKVLLCPEDKNSFDIITVHGHPDAVITHVGKHPCFLRNIFSVNKNKNVIKPGGITYPVSINDYRCFMQSPNEKKCIVYNSNGEYSVLTKNKPGIYMNNQDFKEIIFEYNLTVSDQGYFGTIIKNVYKYVKNAFKSAKNAEQSILKDVDKESKKIHEFLKENTERYGVSYQTNYSNLIKK